MRRILAALLIFLIAGSVLVVGASREADIDQPFAIRAEPVVLDPAAPSHDRVGALRWLGGWSLTSADPDFGGISAMVIDGDGFVAIGDAGGVFRFALGDDGRIARAEIATVPDGPDRPGGGAPRKRDRDAEALALDPATGRIWVGFENANAIWRYAPGLSAAEAHRAPAEMEDWPDNGGAEAMVRLADGRFLVFSERGDGPGDSHEALLFARDPSRPGAPPVRLGYRPPAGFRLTDAAQLPDGRLLLLNRRFSFVEGVSVILSIADWVEPAPDGIIEGRGVATLRPPLTIDNMEALAVVEQGGRTIVWMASDDNFNPLQRTLLFKFELSERR